MLVTRTSVWSLSQVLAFSMSCEKGSKPSSVGCGIKSFTPRDRRKSALRDWSLITGKWGGYETGGGRHVKLFLPRRKGGGGKSFSHAEGGAQKVLR